VPGATMSVPPVSRSVMSRPAVTAICRTLAAVAAVGAGMAAAWLSAGTTGVLAGMAAALAAGNGYAKAYSP
jgi:hypothetical protein